MQDTARDHRIKKKIRYGHQVKAAGWSRRTPAGGWTLHRIERGPGRERDGTLTSKFLYLCGGYHAYEGGYTPASPARPSFAGRLVHPQNWPQDLDYAGKQVVVIGSGAPAVTLVPALAQHAAHVMMLQRSPTYVVSRPAEDALANNFAEAARKLAYTSSAGATSYSGMYFFHLCRRKPEHA